jgi:hypothetical protein
MERGHDIRSTPTSLHADATNKPDPEKPLTAQPDDEQPLTQEEQQLQNAIDRVGIDHPFQFPGIPGVCSAAWTIQTAVIIHEALMQDTSVEGNPIDIKNRIETLGTLAKEVAEYELSGEDPAKDEEVQTFFGQEYAEMRSQTDNGSSTEALVMTTGAPFPNGDSLLNAWGLAEIVWVIANGRLTATAGVSRAIIAFAIQNMRKLLDVEDRIRLYDGAHKSDRVVLYLALFCMFFEVSAGVAVAAAFTGQDELRKFVEYMVEKKSRGTTFFNVDRLLNRPFLQPKGRPSLYLADHAMTQDELIAK